MKKLEWDQLFSGIQLLRQKYPDYSFYQHTIEDSPEQVISQTVQSFIGEFSDKYNVTVIGYGFNDDVIQLIYKPQPKEDIDE